MGLIAHIVARQIFDSRGFPTIEVDVVTDQGISGRASVPSGASTSAFEAYELRDGDKSMFSGKGVLRAVTNVNTIIAEQLRGMYVFDQTLIDKVMIELDGTENKSRLGANAILGVSLAVAKAAANTSGQELFRYLGGVNANTLPLPMINILNGGKLSKATDIQEFMIMPVGTNAFSDALRMGSEVFQSVKNLLTSLGHSVSVSDEGGFVSNLKSNEETLDLMISAIEKAGYKPGEDIVIAIDAAATEFYDKQKKLYVFRSSDKRFSSEELVEYWEKLAHKYPIASIEDGLHEEDWQGWKMLTSVLGQKLQIVGDDLYATNITRLLRGINEKSTNSILVKPNQIGTLTETIDVINLAIRNGITAIISHRSGETEDVTIADLSVAMNTGLIKTGSVSRTDRLAKYNQLLRIEERLGDAAYYPGRNFRFLPK